MKNRKAQRKGLRFSIFSLLFITCCLFAACSGHLTEEDPSKGTIVFNFGGLSESSRAAIGSFTYKVWLFDFSADPSSPAYTDGTDMGTLSSSGTITVNPGNYGIRIDSYLNEAFYAEGSKGTSSDPITIIAGETKSVPITLRVYVDVYLKDDKFSAVTDINLPLAIPLTPGRWAEILGDIDTAASSRSVATRIDLDLSGCTLPADVNGNKIFNPDSSITAGKDKIVSLTLPNDATAIAAGTSSIPTFDGFDNLEILNIGSGIKTIGDSAFEYTGPSSGRGSLTSVIMGNSLETIGEYAFYDHSLTEVSFPDSLKEIYRGAFESNDYLTSVTIPPGVDIGNDAFQHDYNLVDITIGGGCTIGDSAFYISIACPPITVPITVVIGTGGVTYTYTTTGVGTGIWDGFDTFADPSGTGTIPAGTYEWVPAPGAPSGTGTWQYTP